MKILIIGGNRFFGKRLAKLVQDGGHTLTLLNRGNLTDDLGDNVERLICDRDDSKKLKKIVENRYWDIIYDQVCFDYQQAKNACGIFKTGKYIFISSQSVYGPKGNIIENDFNAKNSNVEKIKTSTEDYAEAKRQAEYAFQKFASFPTISVRFPIVQGIDDYTNRLRFHVNKITNEEELYFPNLKAKISFIRSSFAARVLLEMGKNDFTGPINVASPEPIEIEKLISMIESIVSKKAIFSKNKTKENSSPYGISADWYMNCEKLISLEPSLNIEDEKIENWLPEIIQECLI